MLELTDKEKLIEIEKRVRKITACHELFGDSLQSHSINEMTARYSLLWDWIDKYQWEIMGILGYNGEDFKL